MIKKIGFFFFLFWASGELKAQKPLTELDSIKFSVYVETGLDIEAGSNGINNSALWRYAGASFIDDGLKTDLLENAGSNHHLGYALTYRLAYREWLENTVQKSGKGRELWANVKSRAAAGFGQEALRLLLYGNGVFEGQTANLHPLNYVGFSYSQLGYSVLRAQKAWRYELGMALVVGHGYERFKTERGELYTGELGEFLEADLAFTYIKSDTLLWFKGGGLSFKGLVEYSLNDKWMVGASVDDLGWMQLNRSATRVETDSSFRYEGQFVPNLFDATDDFFQGEGPRLDSLLWQEKTGSMGVLLPLHQKVWVNYRLKTGPGLQQLQALVEYRLLPAYRPWIKIRALGQWGKWGLMAEINQGGMAKWGFGGRAVYSLNKWRVGLEINSLQSLIVPQVAYGFSGGIGFAYKLF